MSAKNRAIISATPSTTPMVDHLLTRTTTTQVNVRGLCDTITGKMQKQCMGYVLCRALVLSVTESAYPCFHQCLARDWKESDKELIYKN